ncbi:MAG: PLDc_N domain-containing protein [Ardenticatenaceae bacterium]|nr:PLDc_N domain-containing protein [Ardenticatenaceae bacterium]
MEQIREYLPFLIPIVMIQIALIVAALWDWVKRPQTRGPKWLWLILILFVQWLGPIAYFVFGREEQ